MPKQNLYTFIIILSIIVVSLSLVVFLLQKKQSTPPEPTNLIQPTPTTVEIRVTVPLTPAEIHPTSTGVFEEELPKEQQDLANQKQALKMRLPLSDSSFTITFDYGEDKFIVEINEPKTINRNAFNDWLKTNYPAIPLDRFLLK